MPYTAQDVRDIMIEVLSSSSSGIKSYIDTINLERSHTAPHPKTITYSWGQNQFPFIIVDIDSSEVVTDELTLPSTYNNLPIVHTVNVSGFMKYTDDNIYNWVEDWVEAIIRLLHMYNDCNITYIFLTNVERAELYTERNETLKSFIVTFEAKIN